MVRRKTRRTTLQELKKTYKNIIVAPPSVTALGQVSDNTVIISSASEEGREKLAEHLEAYRKSFENDKDDVKLLLAAQLCLHFEIVPPVWVKDNFSSRLWRWYWYDARLLIRRSRWCDRERTQNDGVNAKNTGGWLCTGLPKSDDNGRLRPPSVPSFQRSTRRSASAAASPSRYSTNPRHDPTGRGSGSELAF